MWKSVKYNYKHNVIRVLNDSQEGKIGIKEK